MKRGVLPWLALLIAALGLLEIAQLRLLQGLENRLLDAFVRQQAAQLEPDPDIVIIDIDERSFARMSEVAGKWTWPRSVHAELLLGLATQKPKAILFDIFFSDPDLERPEADALLVETLRDVDNVYLPTQLLTLKDPSLGLRLADMQALLGIEQTSLANAEARVALLPPAIVPPELWRTGLINFLPDADGVGRRYYLNVDVEGWKIPSLPARVARDLGYALEGDELLLHWRKAHRHLSYADIYEDFSRRQPQRPAAEFRDKIVIIGTAAAGLHDLRATPLGTAYPGVEILATALDNLKNQRAMRAASPLWPAAALAGLMVTLFVLVRRQRIVLAGLVLGCAATSLLAVSYFSVSALWRLPLLTPVIFAAMFYVAAALLSYLHERRSREQAVRLFSRFLNPTIVNRIVERGETIESLSGKMREVSVLFSDIRGFTSLSETRPPQAVVNLLNRYFSLQVAVVFKHGGTLDKFIGDCIMAFWGAPLDDPQHAKNAVAAALEMERVLLQFKQTLGEEGRDFDVGIGIHSGPAVAGFIGAEQKLEYTVIGDSVNLASRIEGLTKGVARILVSRDTATACGDAFDFTARGSYKVKGRSQPVELLEPRLRGDSS